MPQKKMLHHNLHHNYIIIIILIIMIIILNDPSRKIKNERRGFHKIMILIFIKNSQFNHL